MAANTSPVYPRTSDLQVGGAIIGSSANTATDGTGANSSLIFTADSTEGSYIQYVKLKPVSTIAATVARLWYCSNTGSFTPGTTNTAANSSNLGEIGVVAWTASNTLASPDYVIPVNLMLPASTKLFMTFGTSTGAGTTGFSVTVVAGKM